MRAEKGAQALQQLLRVKARVIRDGNLQKIEAEEPVPGDLVCSKVGSGSPQIYAWNVDTVWKFTSPFSPVNHDTVSKDSKSEGHDK